eukprot:TRINITY_DN19706_c0_g1_i1.p1 TRINITY_DN19706_c0_g1~~TRINITY_DN19706_c0_g1_i1.p1  ORF type:complete len:735 (-),score=108.29 TRINITY_DN19706_c0_g1_i1:393-2471(-)
MLFPLLVVLCLVLPQQVNHLAAAAASPGHVYKAPAGVANTTPTTTPYQRAYRPVKSAELVRPERLPLQTLGRYIVDRQHVRVKWSCVNWAGAYSTTYVAGGLQKQPLRTLASRVSELGFNCVRLSYSTEAYVKNPLVDEEYISANEDMLGLRFQDIFDRVVEALTDEGIMVIINNHISTAGWCCNPTQDDGYWYTPDYNETLWIESLTGLARRYRPNPLVVAYDLRNEPHDNPQGDVTWGDGSLKTDWAAAAQRAGNQVLAVNPDALIVVSALCFCIDLRGEMHHQVELMYPNRIVYEVHNYSFSQVATLLVSMFGVSWVHMEHVMEAVALLFLIILIFLNRFWIRLGKPLPPPGIFRATSGLWISVFCMIAAVVFRIMSAEQSLAGCNMYGREAFNPLAMLCIGLGAFFGLFSTWGYCSYLKGAEEAEERLIRARSGSNVNRAPRSDSAASSESQRELLTMIEQQTRGSASSSGRFHSLAPVALIMDEDIVRPTRRIKKGWSSVKAGVGMVPLKDLESDCYEFDRGLCCGLQCGFVSFVLMIIFMVGAIMASLCDSYSYLRWVYDWKFGFALQEGYPYTAPVWLGEFGSDVRGRYWGHLLHYMSVRDIDFAYWAFDGLKLTTGMFNMQGKWIQYDKPRWMEETYGLLNSDYHTIRHTWKLLDLQQIMSSPSTWTADDYPCDRQVVGNACGG